MAQADVVVEAVGEAVDAEEEAVVGAEAGAAADSKQAEDECCWSLSCAMAVQVRAIKRWTVYACFLARTASSLPFARDNLSCCAIGSADYQIWFAGELGDMHGVQEFWSQTHGK